MAFRETSLDDDVLALDVARILESLAERRERVAQQPARPRQEKRGANRPGMGAAPLAWVERLAIANLSFRAVATYNVVARPVHTVCRDPSSLRVCATEETGDGTTLPR